MIKKYFLFKDEVQEPVEQPVNISKPDSRREWFETNIFDESWDMKEKYEDELASLPWVQDFYIGVASEPEKSWQIYITCAHSKVPSMADLKKIFGVNISYFVDFVEKSIDEDSKRSKESLPCPSYLRGPISGDELCVQEGKGGYGAVGILTNDNEKHYATTCYHVCFKNDLPENDIKEGHKILMQDCANESKGCQGATCVYTTDQHTRELGRFCYGLYNDNHDIALIGLDRSINCSDMVKFLGEKSINPALASKKEVKDMLFEKKVLPIEIIRPVKIRGILFTATGVDVKRCPKYKRCYRIKIPDNTPSPSEGDSGSLVYLLYEDEKIPFAYLCMVIPGSDKENVYYCRSLNDSIEELIRKFQLQRRIKPCLRECSFDENNH
ncbi:Hypothetical predicted protein [Paramuricea clavata]|uniref:Uncharacterized protein n=1 Tax=Paramuricea clavata TaxID=317549 RepID=A0A6S7KV02_PARCT|nr:Hypothetical predicted protein [Paramuricea clavata]